MKPVEIIEAAKAKIAEPSMWGQGSRRINRPYETCCIAEALDEVVMVTADMDAKRQAVRAVYNAAGLDYRWGGLVGWNDEPGRTHGEIIATLNLAAAISRL